MISWRFTITIIMSFGTAICVVQRSAMSIGIVCMANDKSQINSPLKNNSNEVQCLLGLKNNYTSGKSGPFDWNKKNQEFNS